MAKIVEHTVLMVAFIAGAISAWRSDWSGVGIFAMYFLFEIASRLAVLTEIRSKQRG